MKVLTFFAVALMCVFAPFTFAADIITETTPTLVDFAVLLFGDNAPSIIGWLSFTLLVWSQLRQLIPARWLAWLPAPIVTLLEWLASNLGQSSNHFENNPNLIKKMK